MSNPFGSSRVPHPAPVSVRFGTPLRFTSGTPYTTATAAIDWLRGRGDVDGTRVGICGVSLGGYLAPRCAAFEPRLKAVASCGGDTR